MCTACVTPWRSAHACVEQMSLLDVCCDEQDASVLTFNYIINYLKGRPPALTTSKALSYSITYRGMQKQAHEETHAPTHDVETHATYRNDM